MGDRGQVFVKDVGVYLYTHWGASSLVEDVQKALAKKWRWDDPEYLTRIIFDEMEGDDRGETGFGIGTGKHGDIWRLVTVECEGKTVTVEDYGKEKFKGSFEDFLNYKSEEC